jgi:hypothetical protein
MGLDSLLSEGMISQETHQELSNTLRSIRFIDLSTFSAKIISGDMDDVTNLSQHIETLLPERDCESIIMLEGWADLREMVPGHHQRLLRNLESSLLDALPQSDVNIIWIDSGTPHTKMNSHYQRRCINPLRYDSPRKTHLDEIIYNIPSTPWRFGWMTPQREEVRVIVQDTPTQAAPWKVPIHVPQLIGFKDKFKGLARRSGIVPPEIVEREHIKAHSMHGRGVSLSSIYVTSEILSGDSLEDMLDNALTLVPSVLRQRSVSRDEEKETPPVKDTFLYAAVQTICSSGGIPMSDRIRVDTTKPPPRPRGSKRYIDTLTESKTGNITRPWSYHRTPKQLPEDDEYEEEKVPTSIYLPNVISSEIDKIDTYTTRKREIKRLYHATRHLKNRLVLPEREPKERKRKKRYKQIKKLKRCCEQIEKCCFKYLEHMKTSQSGVSNVLSKALNEVRDIILRDSQREELWNFLLPLRLGLPDLLNSENRQNLEAALEQNPDLLTLYGNNLFLAVLAALGENSLSLAEPLWNSVAEWTFRQIGMNVQDDETKSVYSFQAVLSNLRSRVKTLTQLNLPEKFSGQEQIGAIIWQGDDESSKALILIPQETGHLTLGQSV